MNLSMSFPCVESREESGETVRLHRLVLAFAAPICDKYHNLMNWLNYCQLHDKPRKTVPKMGNVDITFATPIR